MADDLYAWDPDNKSALITLSNNNRTVEKIGGNAWCNAKGLREMASGKWYWEIYYDNIEVPGGVSQSIGIAPTSVSTAVRVGTTSNDIGFEEWAPDYFWNNGSTSWGLGMADGDILMIAYDADTGSIWFGKNGTWMVSGSPGAGTNPCKTGFTGTQLPVWGTYGAPNKATIRTTSDLCSYTAPAGFSYLTLPVSYYFSGTVYELENTISGAQIFMYRRDTGGYLGSTTSSGDGGFYVTTSYSGSHFLVCLDLEGGQSYNDLVYGEMYPVTISG